MSAGPGEAAPEAPAAPADKPAEDAGDEPCAICFGTLCEPLSLGCGHSYCGRCLGEWEQTAAGVFSCPLCRAPLQGFHELLERGWERAALAEQAAGTEQPTLWNEALASLRKAAAMRPRAAHVQYLLGVVLQQQNDLQGAAAAYRISIAENPAPVEVSFNLGLVLQQQGDLDAAAAAYRTALEVDSYHAGCHCNLGVILQTQGDMGEAEAEYRSALAQDSGLFEAHLGLGIILQEKGQHACAASEYRAVLKSNPAHLDARYNLGVVLLTQGDLEGAVEAYRAVLEASPTHVSAHLGLGLALQQQKDFRGAADALQAALGIDPEQVDARYSLGCVLEGMQDLQGAKAAFQRILEEHPDNTHAHLRLANVLRAMGDTKAACSEYRKLIRSDPTLAAAHCGLGDTLHAQEHLSGAAAAYRAALGADPEHLLALVGLGGVLHSRGDLTGAAAQFRAAVLVDATLASVHRSLGAVLRDLGDLQGAAASYRRALALEPDDAATCLSLAVVLQRSGDTFGAGSLYQAACSRHPDQAEARFTLGVILEIRRIFGEAASSYRAALALDPNHVAAKRNLARVMRRQGSELASASYTAVRTAVQAPPREVPSQAEECYLRLRDTDGDVVEFRMDAEGRLQEFVNGSLELESVGALSYSASLGVIEDDSGDFEISREELSEKVLVLRVLAWHAGVAWYGDEPAGVAEVTLEDEEGDRICFRVSGDRLQEYVNGTLCINRVKRLSYARHCGCITDEVGEFHMRRQERLEKAILLRLLVRHAGALWQGDDPFPPRSAGLPPLLRLPDFRIEPELATSSQGISAAGGVLLPTPASPTSPASTGPSSPEAAAPPQSPVLQPAEAPRPSATDGAAGTRRLWEVVGGRDVGGLVVRDGAPMTSSIVRERLAHGAVVQELEVEGHRLHYRRVSGAGPDYGWVSVRVKEKELLVRHGAPRGA